ncbi:M13-type metalloendopeptidase, partial [Stenotrophomonas sp. SrG]|uniref:M13-type metalloendopeptidase n=1 Tax=Stenotrophomonas sp. SrG TaxID=3414430 RepID=UPI003CFAE7CB
TRTLGENIGALGGQPVAHAALEMALQENPKANVAVDGHSQDQRFFMKSATEWRRNFTDAELRVRRTTDTQAPADSGA